MKRKLNVKLISIFAVALILVSVMSFMSFASDGNEKAAVMIDCSTCEGAGVTATCGACEGANIACADCSEVANTCADCSGTGKVEAPSKFYSTLWSLLPPVITIGFFEF